MRLLTSKCASRHNGVQFFMSHLPTCLRTRRFSEPTFRSSVATKHWKNTVFRDLPTFSRTCIFSLLTFSMSELQRSWPAFSSLHIVGNLASKLPPMNFHHSDNHAYSIHKPFISHLFFRWYQRYEWDMNFHHPDNHWITIGFLGSTQDILSTA